MTDAHSTSKAFAHDAIRDLIAGQLREVFVKAPPFFATGDESNPSKSSPEIYLGWLSVADWHIDAIAEKTGRLESARMSNEILRGRLQEAYTFIHETLPGIIEYVFGDDTHELKPDASEDAITVDKLKNAMLAAVGAAMSKPPRALTVKEANAICGDGHLLEVVVCRQKLEDALPHFKQKDRHPKGRLLLVYDPDCDRHIVLRKEPRPAPVTTA